MNRRNFIRMLGLGAIATPLLAKFTTRQPVSAGFRKVPVGAYPPVVWYEFKEINYDYSKATPAHTMKLGDVTFHEDTSFTERDNGKDFALGFTDTPNE